MHPAGKANLQHLLFVLYIPFLTEESSIKQIAFPWKFLKYSKLYHPSQENSHLSFRDFYIKSSLNLCADLKGIYQTDWRRDSQTRAPPSLGAMKTTSAHSWDIFQSNWNFSSANPTDHKVTPHYSSLKQHFSANPNGWRHAIPQKE